jgi:hypothetical protein
MILGQLLAQMEIQSGARTSMQEDHRSAASVAGVADSHAAPIRGDIELGG